MKTSKGGEYFIGNVLTHLFHAAYFLRRLLYHYQQTVKWRHEMVCLYIATSVSKIQYSSIVLTHHMKALGYIKFELCEISFL